MTVTISPTAIYASFFLLGAAASRVAIFVLAAWASHRKGKRS